MSGIKIEDLPVLEDLSDRETVNTLGGSNDSEWKYLNVRRYGSDAEDDLAIVQDGDNAEDDEVGIVFHSITWD